MKLPLSLRALPDEAMVPWGWVKEMLGLDKSPDDELQDTSDYWCERATEHIGCACHAPGASNAKTRGASLQ